MPGGSDRAALVPVALDRNTADKTLASLDLHDRAIHRCRRNRRSDDLRAAPLGPNFHSPAPPATEHYTPGPQPQATADAPGPAGAAQTFVADRDIPADWWALFQSEPLDGLVRQALRDSPTVEAAKAALRSAQENYVAERGALLLPASDGRLGVTRERVPARRLARRNSGRVHSRSITRP